MKARSCAVAILLSLLPAAALDAAPLPVTTVAAARLLDDVGRDGSRWAALGRTAAASFRDAFVLPSSYETFSLVIFK